MCDSQKPQYAGVILDQAIGKILDYAIPAELQHTISIGSRVVVPVRNFLGKGTVWELKQTSTAPNIKPLQEIAIEPSVITKDLILLSEWMSYYYASPLYKVLLTVLPKHIRNHEKERMEKTVESLISKEALPALILKLKTRYPAQAAVLEVLLTKKSALPLSLLIKEAKVSAGPVATLVKNNIIAFQQAPKETIEAFDAEYFLSKPKLLSVQQQQSFEKIKNALNESSFSAHLLYGVTGSGKTEVYLQAIELALLQDKGVIFLVPEIALATQTLERLKSRFEEKIAVLHHRLSEGEKKESWHQIHSRKARIIVGARSAIFCPVPNLGLIIVDEEHESSYKQTGDSPCYHARDVAVVRAKFCNATIVLGSATPCLESYQNALLGKYVLSELSQRPDKATMPTVHIIDMKTECDKQKRKALFSDALLSAIKKRLQLGEQSLLLLNRRGYHTSQVCLDCSYTSKCPSCESLLTFHLDENKLTCHLCGYETIPPRHCPSCKSGVPMKFKGAGTELVEKSLYNIFPEARVLRMDADTTKRKGSHETLFKKFRSGKADILVGTQMIAKGLHFPSVTLVGVLNADLTLSIPDFRASETLFQLITQVAGRSGRSDLPGEVIIQTFIPNQPTLLHAAAQDYLSFFKEESDTRKLFTYPPFTHLIKVSLSGTDEAKTLKKAEEARNFLIHKLPSFFEFLPIAPSGHSKLENRYRFQFLIKSAKVLAASSTLLALQHSFRNQDIRISVDIDPSSTFF